MSHHPAYAAATLAYGLQVEPYSLIFSARAYLDNKASLDLIRRCMTSSQRGVEPHSTASEDAAATRPGMRSRLGISSLPHEVLRLIERALLEETYKQARCQSWLLFGPKEMPRFHPKYCCARDAPAREQWPSRVQQQWEAARDEFKEWFSFAVPRCSDPCTGHHVCQVSGPPPPRGDAGRSN